MTLQVGVKALVKNSRNEYLFLRRSTHVTTDSAETSWDIPGGRINGDEPLLHALTREIKEETGHTIAATPELIAAQDIFVDSKGLHVVRLTYVLTEDIPTVQLSDEHNAYAWVAQTDVASINTEPYLAEVIKTFLSKTT
jgi:8-oxo-dGTP diphosphatase